MADNTEKKTEKKPSKKASPKTGFGALTTVTKIALIVILIAIVVFGVVKAYQFGYKIFSNEAMEEAPGSEVKILVTEGMSESALADLLTSKGLIADTAAFLVQLKVFGGSSYTILPDEYILNTSMTPREIISTLAVEIKEETEAENLHLFDDETGTAGN